VLALAPEIDTSYETLYAYLHDDVTRKRLSVGLLLDVICRNLSEALHIRRLMQPGGRLLTNRLIELHDDAGDRSPSMLRRCIKVPDAVTSYLLSPSVARNWFRGAHRDEPRHMGSRV